MNKGSYKNKSNLCLVLRQAKAQEARVREAQAKEGTSKSAKHKQK